jgi:hypothetical protein
LHVASPVAREVQQVSRLKVNQMSTNGPID